MDFSASDTAQLVPSQCPLDQLNLDKIVPNVRQSTLQAVIRGKIDLDSVIHSDGWRGYYGLVDVGYAKHFRVEHGRNEFANEKSLLMVSLDSAEKGDVYISYT